MEEKKRYPYLDALRGIAVMMVIMYHTPIFMINKISGPLYRLSGEGARGVQIFYIVSALTLFMSLSASNFIGSKKEKIKFFIRRFFRVAPMFYFTIIVFLLAGMLFPFWNSLLRLDDNLISLVSSFTFTNNFFPQFMNSVVPGQWSVAIEMFFYLMVPSLFLRIKSLKDAKKLFLWIIILSSLVELILPIFLPGSVIEWTKIFLFYSIPIQLPVFLLGIISFFILRERNDDLKGQVNEFISLLIKVSLIEIIFIILRFSISGYLDLSLITPRVYVESVFFMGAILLLSNGYFSFLYNKLFQYIGKISYSMYLVQFISFVALTHNDIYKTIAHYVGNGYIEYIILSIAAIALSIGISSITFKLIEFPGQRFGSYLTKIVVGHKNLQ